MTDGSVPPFPPGLRRGDRASRVRALRAAIDRTEPLVLPGIVTAMNALQVEHAGFAACYLTGAGLANVQYALPDVGLLGLEEVASQARRLTATTSLPVVVDADTGYGGPLSVVRAVEELERAGAAGIQLEDQELPKRCGHFERKRLVSADEMVAKVRAALAARSDGTVIFARTDAVAVEGYDAAVARAAAYRDAGADVIFIEALRSVEELADAAAALRPVPMVANIVEGGKTPELGVNELYSLGYSVILYANTINRVMAKAAADAMQRIRHDGDTSGLHDAMLDWKSRQELFGLDEADELEDYLRAVL